MEILLIFAVVELGLLYVIKRMGVTV